MAAEAETVELLMLGSRTARQRWHRHHQKCSTCGPAWYGDNSVYGAAAVAERACPEGAAAIRAGWHLVRDWIPVERPLPKYLPGGHGLQDHPLHPEFTT